MAIQSSPPSTSAVSPTTGTAQPSGATPGTPAPRSAPLPFLGLACAVGVSSIYYNQPLLGEMGRTFAATPERIGLVAVTTQVGYACGMLFFVPLGDVLERRALMMRMYGTVSVALLLVALAPSLPLVVLASILVGVFASVTHIVLPIAPDLVGDAERGRAIGIVMTGLLLAVATMATAADPALDMTVPLDSTAEAPRKTCK